MRLSSYTDYALRTLIYVGSLEESVTIRKISEVFQISKDHLGKIVSHLTRAGYLVAVRGRHGGLRLAKDADQINLGQLLEEFENFKLVECFESETNTCPINGMCSLKGVLKEAQKSFLATVGRYTLADVIKNKTLKEFCVAQQELAG